MLLLSHAFHGVRLSELPLDVSERVLGAEHDRHSFAQAVVNLEVSNSRLNLRECLLPVSVFVDIGLVENHNTLDRDVAELARVVVNHGNSDSTQLHNGQALLNVELLEALFFSFLLGGDSDADGSLGDSVCPLDLLFVACLGQLVVKDERCCVREKFDDPAAARFPR